MRDLQSMFRRHSPIRICILVCRIPLCRILIRDTLDRLSLLPVPRRLLLTRTHPWKTFLCRHRLHTFRLWHPILHLKVLSWLPNLPSRLPVVRSEALPQVPFLPWTNNFWQRQNSKFLHFIANFFDAITKTCIVACRQFSITNGRASRIRKTLGQNQIRDNLGLVLRVDPHLKASRGCLNFNFESKTSQMLLLISVPPTSIQTGFLEARTIEENRNLLHVKSGSAKSKGLRRIALVVLVGVRKYTLGHKGNIHSCENVRRN